MKTTIKRENVTQETKAIQEILNELVIEINLVSMFRFDWSNPMDERNQAKVLDEYIKNLQVVIHLQRWLQYPTIIDMLNDYGVTYNKQ